MFAFTIHPRRGPMRLLLIPLVLLTPVLAKAQPDLFDFRVRVGKVYSAGCLDAEADKTDEAVNRVNTVVDDEGASADTTTTHLGRPYDECDQGRSRLYLMWDHVQVPGDTLAPAGTVVRRQATGLVGGQATTLTYADTLVAPMVDPGRGTRAPVVPGGATGDAVVYPDAKRPDIVHVNFLLTPGGVSWGNDTLTGEQLRGVDYYFQLRNREGVTLPYTATAVGAVTVPLKVRVGADGTGSDVSADAGLGLYVGRRWGSVTYTYHQHAAKTLETTRHRTFGPFIGLSTASLDSTNALQSVGAMSDEMGGPSDEARTPLAVEKNVVVLSVGLGHMWGVRGVEAGLFAGYDIALTRDAEWEYDLRRHAVPWLGFALGFKLLKL